MTNSIASVVLTALILCVPGMAQSTSIDIPGVFFKEGRPAKGESLESSVSDSQELKNLARAVDILKRYSNVTFEVVGHTDQYECSGQDCHDLALRRALLVYRHLLNSSIDPKRVISLTEYTSSRPIAGKREEYWVNQRAEINFAIDP